MNATTSCNNKLQILNLCTGGLPPKANIISLLQYTTFTAQAPNVCVTVTRPLTTVSTHRSSLPKPKKKKQKRREKMDQLAQCKPREWLNCKVDKINLKKDGISRNPSFK